MIWYGTYGVVSVYNLCSSIGRNANYSTVSVNFGQFSRTHDLQAALFTLKIWYHGRQVPLPLAESDFKVRLLFKVQRGGCSYAQMLDRF